MKVENLHFLDVDLACGGGEKGEPNPNCSISTQAVNFINET